MFTTENDDENVGGGRSSFPSSPTEMIGTRLATHKRLNQLEGIVNAINKVYTRLPETHRQLLQLKYWTKPQQLTWEGIAQKLHVSRRQAFYWRDEIVNLIGQAIGWR